MDSYNHDAQRFESQKQNRLWAWTFWTTLYPASVCFRHDHEDKEGAGFQQKLVVTAELTPDDVHIFRYMQHNAVPPQERVVAESDPSTRGQSPVY